MTLSKQNQEELDRLCLWVEILLGTLRYAAGKILSTLTFPAREGR